MAKKKIGSEHAAAMLRLGLAELRAAAYPDSNVARHSEYGLYGTKTPGEVAEDRRGDERDLDDEASNSRGSILGDRLRKARDRDEGGRDDRGLELERD